MSCAAAPPGLLRDVVRFALARRVLMPEPLKLRAIALSLAFPLTLGPAQAGCVDDGVDETELATDELEITDAAPTVAHQESVRLMFSTGPSPCTALVLNRHWILTAAHCIDRFANNSTVNNSIKVYSTVSVVEGDDATVVYGDETQFAKASYYRHPSWNGTGSDKNDDLGLIKLYGPGVTDPDQLDPFSARIYWGASEPWKSTSTGNRDFYVAGYGMGGPVGDLTPCDDAMLNMTKRLGRFRLDPSIPHYSTSYAAKAQTPYGQDICGGDSGAPYLLSRSGWYAFAIHSGNTPTAEDGGQEFGTLIRPKMAWIEQTAATRLPALTCKNYTWIGTTYRQCDE